jgi:hypothetical protein
LCQELDRDCRSAKVRDCRSVKKVAQGPPDAPRQLREPQPLAALRRVVNRDAQLARPGERES